MLWRKTKGFGCSLFVKILSILLSSLPSTIFSVTETDSPIALALEVCATIPPHVDATFQFWKLMNTSANYLLQSLSYFNCI